MIFWFSWSSLLIITKLQGGLGNQMFQYAAARACSSDGAVVFDLSFLKHNTASTDAFTSREFRLAIFNHIKAGQFNPLQEKIIHDRRFAYRLLKKIIYPGFKVISDHNTNPAAFTQIAGSHSVYLDGYFQNEGYFSHIRPLLLHEFYFPELQGKAALVKDNVKACGTSVAIHVRRGDYMKPQVAAYHGVLPLSYYTNAIAHINNLVSDAHYFIFSDDMPWCRKNFAFLNDKVTFTDTGEEDWVDMALMSSCTHQIIANSSFSWWAAWLNPTGDKIVIAPEKWFADSEAMKQAGNIVPDNWIKV